MPVGGNEPVVVGIVPEKYNLANLVEQIMEHSRGLIVRLKKAC